MISKSKAKSENGMRMRAEFICFLYGAAVFWAAPLFTHVRDPFDSIYPVCAQLPVFLFLGIILREFRWKFVLWLLAGEATYPILKGSNLWPLSIVVTLFYMVPGILIYAGAAKFLGRPGQNAEGK
jgi:hypothetical protein